MVFLLYTVLIIVFVTYKTGNPLKNKETLIVNKTAVERLKINIYLRKLELNYSTFAASNRKSAKT